MVNFSELTSKENDLRIYSRHYVIVTCLLRKFVILSFESNRCPTESERREFSFVEYPMENEDFHKIVNFLMSKMSKNDDFLAKLIGSTLLFLS